jgi:hypothetical protein
MHAAITGDGFHEEAIIRGQSWIVRHDFTPSEVKRVVRVQ